MKSLKSATVRIMGVDPGTRVVGWGVIDCEGSRMHLIAAGAIAPSEESVPERLGVIAHELTRLAAEFGPTEVALEDAFHAKSAKAAIRLGEGRGAVFAALAGLPIHAYAANEVKKAVTGKGGRSKQSVARMVTILLGLQCPPEPLDASDALALAICHANRRRSAAARVNELIAPRRI